MTQCLATVSVIDKLIRAGVSELVCHSKKSALGLHVEFLIVEERYELCGKYSENAQQVQSSCTVFPGNDF